MTLEGRGRIIRHAPGKVMLYLPASIVNDSNFPFEVGEHVTVKIQGKKLVTEPYRAKD